MKAYLNIVLHAHLPYVRHPEHERFFEENWLFEAITECYLPLLKMLDRLQADSVDCRFSLSLSPTLITLLKDPLLQQRYLQYMDHLLTLVDKEISRTRSIGQDDLQALALYYRDCFSTIRHAYLHDYAGDLLAAFKKHHLSGRLQLMTTAATHAFLPLLKPCPAAVHSQIQVGISVFEQQFGFKPKGFWLPECGYFPGLEKQLKSFGIDYFFLDSHGLLEANQQPHYGVYAPLDCGNGVFAFGRDAQSSEMVWSSRSGYPGNPDYREFHRDIGYELTLEELSPMILEEQGRGYTGIKYFKVTGDTEQKSWYQPERAIEQARQDAQDFVRGLQQRLADLQEGMDQPPVFMAPYDAELFGHWWFEGPIWLEQVLRLTAQGENDVQNSDCRQYLTLYSNHQQSQPAASSWGEEGYSSYWLNESNAWIYPLLHKASDDLHQLIQDLAHVRLTPLQTRALNQAMRSVLLSQASDWPFILKSGAGKEYAEKRIEDYLARFNYLYDAIRKNRINERYLVALEIMDEIFPDIDYRDYKKTADNNIGMKSQS